MPPSHSDRPSLEVADIFRGEAASFLPTHLAKLAPEQKRVYSDIQSCRTAVMGGHVRACDGCDHREIAYNSCRNRHCPKCQAMARAKWLAEREAELLPIAYFHIVFTMPAELAAVALQNKRLLYGMLFEAASETLKQVAANPRHLGAAQIGLLAVLHTWGQNLMHHPHLHCVVSGGGLSPDASRWIASRDYFFLPVKVLSRVFRNKFRRLLERAFERGELNFYGKLISLAEPKAFREFLEATTTREWVVYAKRPFREPACVLKYLARYTHRVAISNHRLISYRDGKVTFRYKDYAREGTQRTMTLESSEFIRRFLMHVLPSGFMRIRHYGFLANRYRKEKLETCRRLLGCDEPTKSQDDVGLPAREPKEQADDTQAEISCPVCKTGRMQIIDSFDRTPRRCEPPPQRSFQIPYQDSS
jgi:hypothetical protein